jgi:hypothetical protein
MKRQKQMRKAFGINEFGLIDFPVKISNVQVSRICMATKEDAPGAFLTDLKRTTQRFPIDNATGSVSGRQSGNHSETMPLCISLGRAICLMTSQR